MIVTSSDVVAAIRECGGKLSDKNVANFLKDFIRKPTCNKNWPSRLRDMRITARQRYGETQILEFVPYKAGDEVPFPDRYDPIPTIPITKLESLSLPRSARALGRPDEPWLTQVVVYQRIIHYHLAVCSPLNLVELTHLQMSVKTQPEIDAVYLATLEGAKGDSKAIITCEAKQFGERILEDQIREQVARTFEATKALPESDKIDAIIPMAVKVVRYPDPKKGDRYIYVVEFEKIQRTDFDSKYSQTLHDLPLILASRGIYELRPPVRGISDKLTAFKAPLDEGDDL